MKIFYCIVVCVLAAVGAAFVGERLKGEPEFCISCHLGDGAKLHSAKYKALMAENPVALSGLHRKKSREKFGCHSCHSGKSLSLKLKIFTEEAKNTVSYFLFKFEEPKNMDASLMPDEACEKCHQSYKGGETSFHGMKAHTPKVKFTCVSCHKAHQDGDAEYFGIVQDVVVSACRKCHPHLPQSFRLKGKKLE